MECYPLQVFEHARGVVFRPWLSIHVGKSPRRAAEVEDRADMASDHSPAPAPAFRPLSGSGSSAIARCCAGVWAKRSGDLSVWCFVGRSGFPALVAKG